MVLSPSNLNYRIKTLLAKRKQKYSNPVKEKTIFLAILKASKIKGNLTIRKIRVILILCCLFFHWEMAIITMQHWQINYRYRNVRRKSKGEYQELRGEMRRYLMKRFKYCKMLLWLSLILLEAKFLSNTNMINEQPLKSKKKTKRNTF